MLRSLIFSCVFLILYLNCANGLSRSFSAGGVWNVVNSNGFTIRQEPDRLYCGTLVCNNAVNCEIIKHGTNVMEKCMDINRRIIDEKSYYGSTLSDDVELFFGPAYARQADEQARRTFDQVNGQIHNTFDNINNNLNGRFPNNFPNQNYPNQNYPNQNYGGSGSGYGQNYGPTGYPNNYGYGYGYNSAMYYGNEISYFIMLLAPLLAFLIQY